MVQTLKLLYFSTKLDIIFELAPMKVKEIDLLQKDWYEIVAILEVCCLIS